MIPGAWFCDVFPLPPIPSYVFSSVWIYWISGFVPLVGRTSDTFCASLLFAPEMVSGMVCGRHGVFYFERLLFGFSLTLEISFLGGILCAFILLDLGSKFFPSYFGIG
jgi:hypothetical protein